MNRIELSRIITDRMLSAADQLRVQWDNPVGTATRHLVIDDLLPSAVAAEIFDAYPENAQGFGFRETFRERKYTSAQLSAQKPILSEITYALQDESVVQALAKAIGMQALEPDPKLYAGGLSMMYRGHFLNPHIDNSHDVDRHRYRRLNLLYYVTPKWSLQDGGNLELWNDNGTIPVTIESSFNRLVIMETNRSSLHSVSPVVSEGPRCCVSSYYFSEESPDGSNYFHVTSFTGRPEETVKRALAALDNGMRNLVSKIFRTGRGRNLLNK